MPQAHRTRGCLKCKGGNQCVLLCDGSLSYSDTWRTLIGLEQPLAAFMVHTCVSCYSLIMCSLICVRASEDVHLYISYINDSQILSVRVFEHTHLCLNQGINQGKKTLIFTKQANS